MSPGPPSAMDRLLRTYFSDLDAALAGLPKSRRQHLVAEIRQHVDDARAEWSPRTESELQAILDRVGTPADIAAAAMAEEDEPATKRPIADRLLMAIIALLLTAGLAVGLILAFIVPSPSRPLSASGHTGSYPTTTTTTATTTAPPPPTTTSLPVVSPPVSAVAPATTVPPTTVPTPPVVPNGVYVSDVTGAVPHYFLSLTTGADGSLTGSVDFVYQDGQTSTVFTFAGSAQSGVATLNPTSVPRYGSAAQDPATVPSAISATMGGSTTQGYGVSLGSCSAYLHYIQSEAQCDFVYSPTGSVFLGQ